MMIQGEILTVAVIGTPVKVQIQRIGPVPLAELVPVQQIEPAIDAMVFLCRITICCIDSRFVLVAVYGALRRAGCSMLETDIRPENNRVSRIELFIDVKVDAVVLVPAYRMGVLIGKGGAIRSLQVLCTALRSCAHVLAVEKIAAVTFGILAPVVMIVHTTRPGSCDAAAAAATSTTASTTAAAAAATQEILYAEILLVDIIGLAYQ